MLRAKYDDLLVALINTATISQRMRERHFADAEDWHANDAETSLMLAIAPHLLRSERLADADDPDRTGACVFAYPVNRTSRNGVTGMPSRASSEKGEQLFTWMVEDLSEMIERGMDEEPPQPYSYFQNLNIAQ
jgi:creatinine amidohydrolase